ncbi:MAG: tRNA-(ms[2]io[6]A)-hydroxylase (EC [uncultured Aureispira sp.]|uniref:tRNA-(Ms[2]io[6]A)-hydroxylase (EC) n=1 Tax=uncultured Aureispira sp. TaxID=1331704 RepID=A0A6S6S9U1_9BACT|nr:MAG: tRNA-(ms[2]io[6]A)-hydroxylase (EC [uncultured Aureispira sp.]
MENKNTGKRVLGIQLPTDPRWVNMAEMSLQDILTDHAYCEQKATTSCITLIQRYSDKELLVEKVSPIVSEEWSHFRLVLKELEKRGLKLGHQRRDEYVNGLLKFIRKGVTPDELFLDRILICAMIEARSCERFRLLSLNVKEEALRSFYHKFMVSEAGHYRLFLDLAEHYLGKEVTQTRWQEWLAFEATLVKGLKPRADRMH